MIKKILIIVFVGLLNINSSAYSDNKILSFLKEGKKLVFIRHAIAPGTGDPDNFDINDCSTQRNLDKNGIVQSKKIGLFFKIFKCIFCSIYAPTPLACKNLVNRNFIFIKKGSNFFRLFYTLII